MANKKTKKDNIKEEELTINQRKFLAAYSKTGNVTESAKLTDMSRKNHYRWIGESKLYEQEAIEAEIEATEIMEYEARRRAVIGVEEPVFYQGEECGTVRKYSDTLLMFMLKGVKPDKYADRVKSDIKSDNTNKNIEISNMSMEEKKEWMRKYLSGS